MRNRTDLRLSWVLALFAALLIGTLPFGAAGIVVAQEAALDQTADFEAMLFGESGEAGAPDRSGASEAAQGGPVFAAAAGAETARIETLIGGTVVADATATSSRALGGELASSDLSGKLFAKLSVPDSGSLYLAYNASHAVFQAYSGDGTPPPAADTDVIAFELSEIHYSFDIAKRVFVRIGNQLVAWGPSRIWTPVDFINLEKVDSFSDVDFRVGKPGLRLHLLLPSSNAFFFADFSRLTEDGSYGDPAKKANLGGRFDTTWRGFEWGLTSYGGSGEQVRFGADFSGRLISTTIYGEMAAAREYGAFDPLFQASFGFSRALDELKRWTLSAEAFYNSRGRDLSGFTAADVSALPPGEGVPLYQGSYYLYGALAADKLFSPYLSTTLSAISNLQDLSYSVKLSQKAAFPRAVPFTASISYAGGGEDKEFTRYAGDGAVALSLSTKIEF